MTISDKILKAREERSNRIDDLLNQYKVVISIRVNFPGKDKNHRLANLIFHALRLNDLNLSYGSQDYFYSDDGPYVLLGSNEKARLIKDKTVRLENNHPLGRFYDIDVYEKHRVYERKEKRVCFLCHQMAHVCVREKRHSYDELYQYIYEKTMTYYADSLQQMINEAMMNELDLHPKFGLITKYSNGSHKDMNYDMMVNVKDVLMPCFIDIFKRSIYIDDPIESVIDDFIHIGQKAEEKMYQMTNHVNCYKGLIFHIGLIVMTYGYYLSHHLEDDFQSAIIRFANIIVKRLDNFDTFGQYAYDRYQMRGAKGEALSGYQHAIKVKELYSINQLMERLVYLIVEIEDTNLLKRAGSLEAYHSIKEWFVGLDVSNQNVVELLSEKCIKKNLSFGGSADMLVISILLDLFEQKHDNICL